MRVFVLAFPVWLILGSVIALNFPDPFRDLLPVVPWILMAVMFGMGVTLTADDFRRVWKRPFAIIAGVMIQFTVMPVLGLLITNLWVRSGISVPPDYLTGILLVAMAPGGTASNIICFLAGFDTALSVSLTMVSTVLSVVVTPLLLSFALEREVRTDAPRMILDIGLLVLLPVMAGIILRRFFRNPERWAPSVSVVGVLFIVMAIVAGSAGSIISAGFKVIWLPVLLHTGGFLLGGMAARLTGQDTVTALTISVETGMQNSGLAAVLAVRSLGNPAAAVIPAVSVVVHSVLASFFVAGRSASGLYRRIL